MASHSRKIRKLLSLDGGGVRGMSTITILRELMERLARERGVDEIHPWQEFDMIGGTSTGGLLAIMLGRLRMTIDQCEEKFLEFSKEIFTPVKSQANLPGRLSDYFQANGKFSTKALEESIKRIVRERDLSDDELFHETSDCKVFVSVVSGHDGANTVLRTYTHPKRPNRVDKHCKIWEAARATSAASTLFDPITIGPRGATFIDGALGFNNPIRLLERESRQLWPNDDRLFLSIGTGSPPTRNMQGNVFDLAETLKEMMVETEKTADGFQQDNPDLVSQNRYYRFNVLHGLEDVSVQEYQATDRICGVTYTYLELSDTITKTDLFISSVAALEPALPEQPELDATPPVNAYAAPYPTSPPSFNGQDSRNFVGGTPTWQTGGNMPSISPSSTPGVSPYSPPGPATPESQYHYSGRTTLASQYPHPGHATAPSQYPYHGPTTVASQYPPAGHTSGPSPYPLPDQTSGPSQYSLPFHTSSPSQYSLPAHASELPASQTSGASSFSPPSSAPTTNSAPPQSRAAARREREALGKELIQSIDDDDIAKMATLLVAGADPNARGIVYSLGNTESWALYIAAKMKRYDMVKLLIDHKADVNPSSDTPPLIAAVESKDEDIVELLINSGANPNAVDPSYGTALQRAVIARNLEMVKLLIELGADITVKSPPMGSAIAAAVFNCSIDIFHILILCGADVSTLGPCDQHTARQWLKSAPPASSWRPPGKPASSAPASAPTQAPPTATYPPASTPAPAPYTATYPPASTPMPAPYNGGYQPAPAPTPSPYNGEYQPAPYQNQHVNSWGYQTPTPPAANTGYASYQPWAPPAPGNQSYQYNAPPPAPWAQAAQPYSWN